jgi:general secretion pathway protein D
VVIAANNEEAEILVGSQRPFVQVSRSLPTDVPTRDQVVQYKDVGTRLKVRPTISADGYVALAVIQEVNSATTETQFDAPVISTRTVSTNLLVRDSQTVVLGGLADKQREVIQGGVPVLSSIPLLGGFFGRTTRQSTDTEFFLFLTPHVIRTDDEAERLTRPIQQRSTREARP